MLCSDLGSSACSQRVVAAFTAIPCGSGVSHAWGEVSVVSQRLRLSALGLGLESLLYTTQTRRAPTQRPSCVVFRYDEHVAVVMAAFRERTAGAHPSMPLVHRVDILQERAPSGRASKMCISHISLQV